MFNVDAIAQVSFVISNQRLLCGQSVTNLRYGLPVRRLLIPLYYNYNSIERRFSFFPSTFVL